MAKKKDILTVKRSAFAPERYLLYLNGELLGVCSRQKWEQNMTLRLNPGRRIGVKVTLCAPAEMLNVVVQSGKKTGIGKYRPRKAGRCECGWGWWGDRNE